MQYFMVDIKYIWDFSLPRGYEEEDMMCWGPLMRITLFWKMVWQNKILTFLLMDGSENNARKYLKSSWESWPSTLTLSAGGLGR